MNVSSSRTVEVGGETMGCRPLRVLVVAESFLPRVDGVANSVVRVLERLDRDGHDVVVVAAAPGPESWGRFPVVRVRSVGFPGYRDVRLAWGRRVIASVIAGFRPDVVHVASPAVIGAVALRECRRAGVPAIAVFQTDLAGFARGYGLTALAPLADRWVATVHGLATSTLAPSSSSVSYLDSLGVHDVRRWPRGVDGLRFHPDRRSESLRTSLGAPGRTIVGYAGRLAKEKELDRLMPIAEDPSVSLVIIGHGPCERELRAAMPAAAFLGFLSGDELAAAIASLDVFVHTGRHETFCQTVQEALCAGVPVVAPRAGGPIDLVEDGGNGLLWDPVAPSSLVDCVGRVVGDAAFRGRLAARARASVVDRTWESVLADLVGCYEQLAAVGAAR